MKMRDIINDFGKKTVDGYIPDIPCRFAAPEDTIGMLDTSYNSSGTSGIAFLKDKIRVCRCGDISDAYYCDIKSAQIIPSYESTYEDELLIYLDSGSIRVSDCALNKFFLRQLIESLLRVYPSTTESDRRAECEEYYKNSEPKRTAEIKETAAKSIKAEKKEKEKIKETELKSENETEPSETNPVYIDFKMPEYTNAEKTGTINIPEEKIEWINGAEDNNDNEEKNIDAIDDISEMSHNETISYLVDSINEINSAAKNSAEALKRDIEEQPEFFVGKIESEPAPVIKERLTIEPESDDIYIQASRRIRGLCESGKISMKEIERALKEQLIPTAEKFSDLTVSVEGLEPDIAAKTEELKVASDRLPEYFKLSEDIAARVMFYMLFVMLTCIDRIAQTPETKRQLNLFFVSYGTAGISFSMLETGM